MGHPFSRQATTTRSKPGRKPPTLRSYRVLHLEDSDTETDACRRSEDSNRDQLISPFAETAESHDSRSYTNALKDVRGNLGIPKRQPKYGRIKSHTETIRITDDGPRRVRKSDTQQTRGVPKARPHTGPHISRSAEYQAHYPSHSSQTKECIICADTRSLHRFPDRLPTKDCSHDIDACRRCLRSWIQSEFSTKVWNEINCPICMTRMQIEDIRKFAPDKVFRR
jgi:hypothetical protein